MKPKAPSILLVSQSPRRREILETFGFRVQVQNPRASIPEVNLGENKMNTPEKVVCENAKRKAGSVSTAGHDWVLSSDTIVVLNGKQYGKPRNKKEALLFLSELSGKTHQVFSSYYLRRKSQSWTGYDVSHVTFKKLSRSQILDYLKQVEVMDKAGAYAIQNGGERIIAGFQGSFYTIMGLPIEKIIARITPKKIIRQ
ncbi:MAG: septum formation protein Maf [Candidatus Aureabacteria bacterium]|nr:septum formation protein Maf [Candidatus Auribacterota bacterium]